MNKYNVYLADNWKRSEPFTTDWDYELVGDVFRAEFDEWFKEQEKLANAGAGKTRQLFRGEYIKKFMLSKRINIVDDPSNNGLKSVFMLKFGEKKSIDERAKNNLASRFEYKTKTRSDGTESQPEGFMKFELTEGTEEKSAKDSKTFQVSGNDIEYFTEEAQNEVLPEIKEEVVVEKFICEVCDKGFDSNRALHMHSLSHKKE